MGLYDIMDEIAAKQVTKTETGDNRIMGVMVGVVASNYNKKLSGGRVCVTIPVRDKDANELRWARVAMPSGGKEWGHYFLPEVGDQVLVAFEQGNIEKPYIIGCINKDNDKFLTSSNNEKNEIKQIVTKNGNTLKFVDKADDQGNSQDTISLYTKKQEHKLILDNENDKITLADKSAKNGVTIDTANGRIEIKCETKLTISVGDKITMTFNGDSGTVSVDCDKFNVTAGQGVNLKTDSTMAIEGANVKVEGSSMVKVESSGMAKIGGSPIKIG